MANELVTTTLQTELTLKDADFTRKFKDAMNNGAASAEGFGQRTGQTFDNVAAKGKKAAEDIERKHASMFTRLSNMAGEFGFKLAKAFAFGAITIPTGLLYGITKLNADLAKTASFAEGVGLTVNQFKQFQTAIIGTGVQSEKAMFFVQEWAKRSGELQLGIGTISVTLRKLGIDVKQFQGLNPVQTMEQLIKATSHLSKQQQIKIFDVSGIGGNTVINTLKNFSGSLADVRKEWSALGLNLDPSQVNEAKRFTKEVSVLKTIFDNLLTQIAANSAGPLADLIKDITGKIKEAGGIKAAAFKISESILNGVGYFLDALAKLAKMIENFMAARNEGWGKWAVRSALESGPIGKYIAPSGPSATADRTTSNMIAGWAKSLHAGADQQGRMAQQAPMQSIATSVSEAIRSLFSFSEPVGELTTDTEKAANEVFKFGHTVARMTDKFSTDVMNNLNKMITAGAEGAVKGAAQWAKSIAEVGIQMRDDAGKLLNPHSNLADLADESVDPVTGKKLEQREPSRAFRSNIQDFLKDMRDGNLDSDEIDYRLNSLQDDAESGSLSYFKKDKKGKLQSVEQTNSGEIGAVQELRDKFQKKLPMAKVEITVNPSKEFDTSMKELAADGVELAFEKESRMVSR